MSPRPRTNTRPARYAMLMLDCRAVLAALHPLGTQARRALLELLFQVWDSEAHDRVPLAVARRILAGAEIRQAERALDELAAAGVVERVDGLLVVPMLTTELARQDRLITRNTENIAKRYGKHTDTPSTGAADDAETATSGSDSPPHFPTTGSDSSDETATTGTPTSSYYSPHLSPTAREMRGGSEGEEERAGAPAAAPRRGAAAAPDEDERDAESAAPPVVGSRGLALVAPPSVNALAAALVERLTASTPIGPDRDAFRKQLTEALRFLARGARRRPVSAANPARSRADRDRAARVVLVALGRATDEHGPSAVLPVIAMAGDVHASGRVTARRIASLVGAAAAALEDESLHVRTGIVAGAGWALDHLASHIRARAGIETRRAS